MDYVIGLLILGWVGYIIAQGYMRENAPPLTMADNGHGVMEPICPECNARLVTITRSTGSGIAGGLALVVGLAGFVLFLFNWIAGGIVLILAILINMAGKGKKTVLACPSCQTDIRTLD
jgi:hypothetical protein